MGVGNAGATFWVLDSWVAAGVGSCAGSLVAVDDTGSTCSVCASAPGAVGSAAAGLGGGAAAAGAAPGRRRAALGANFLPVVFSSRDSATSVHAPEATHY